MVDRTAVRERVLSLLEQKRKETERNPPSAARQALRNVHALRVAKSKLDSRAHQRHFKTIDDAVELLKIDRIVHRLDAYQGTFEMGLRSHVTRMLLTSGFERGLTQFYETVLSPGAHYMDVGANFGLYTVFGSKLVGDAGRVVAVEPAPTILPLLKSNLWRNGCSNVQLFEGVASSEEGEMELHFPEGNEEYASMAKDVVSRRFESRTTTVRVPAKSLDTLIGEYGIEPVLLKTDTEGADEVVLRSGRKSLETLRPIVLLECNDRYLASFGSSSKTMKGYFDEVGYTLYDFHSGEPVVDSCRSTEGVAIPNV